MNSVVFKNIVKSYGKNTNVIKDFSLDIKEGEFVILVGPSGCGKSTLLRILAGLESISSGDVFVNGKRMNNIPAKDRDIAMVFQNYALYPHMNIFNNMAFGLKLRKLSEAEIEKQVNRVADMLEIRELLHRKPKELSGGQRQRAALGRAIVRAPKVFLFDEPLSNLDAKLRVQMRTQIKKLHQDLKTTMIYVTHDQVEAMTMGDRIVILKDGIVQQIGTPLEVYQSPENMFVASFIGSPAMNFIEGQVVGNQFIRDDLKISLGKDLNYEKFTEDMVLGIRPEDVKVGEGDIDSNIVITEPLGNQTILNLVSGKQVIIAMGSPREQYIPESRVKIHFDPERILFFDKKTQQRIQL